MAGEKIKNGALKVPMNPIIPYIEGMARDRTSRVRRNVAHGADGERR